MFMPQSAKRQDKMLIDGTKVRQRNILEYSGDRDDDDFGSVSIIKYAVEESQCLRVCMYTLSQD